MGRGWSAVGFGYFAAGFVGAFVLVILGMAEMCLFLGVTNNLLLPLSSYSHLIKSI